MPASRLKPVWTKLNVVFRRVVTFGRIVLNGRVIQVLEVAGLIIIALQLRQQVFQTRQQVDHARAANVHSLTELMATLNMRLTEPEMAALWEYSDEISSIPDKKERTIKESQYTTLLASHLLFFENVYSQHQAGLLPEHIYKGWDADLQGIVQNQPIEKYWKEWRGAYYENFRNYIDALIGAKPPTASPSP